MTIEGGIEYTASRPVDGLRLGAVRLGVATNPLAEFDPRSGGTPWPVAATANAVWPRAWFGRYGETVAFDAASWRREDDGIVRTSSNATGFSAIGYAGDGASIVMALETQPTPTTNRLVIARADAGTAGHPASVESQFDLPADTRAVRDVAFSPDGRRLCARVHTGTDPVGGPTEFWLWTNAVQRRVRLYEAVWSGVTWNWLEAANVPRYLRRTDNETTSTLDGETIVSCGYGPDSALRVTRLVASGGYPNESGLAKGDGRVVVRAHNGAEALAYDYALEFAATAGGDALTGSYTTSYPLGLDAAHGRTFVLRQVARHDPLNAVAADRVTHESRFAVHLPLGPSRETAPVDGAHARAGLSDFDWTHATSTFPAELALLTPLDWRREWRASPALVTDAWGRWIAARRVSVTASTGAADIDGWLASHGEQRAAPLTPGEAQSAAGWVL